VPYLQVSPVASLAILIETSLPRALVSTFDVVDVTVKGPKGELTGVSSG
jgi:hypothetical protein